MEEEKEDQKEVQYRENKGQRRKRWQKDGCTAKNDVVTYRKTA